MVISSGLYMDWMKSKWKSASRHDSTLIASRFATGLVEWKPLFYRDVTIIVHATRLPTRNPYFSEGSCFGPYKPEYIITRSAPEDFERRLLLSLAPCKLSSIRYLEYDASIFDRYIRHPHRFPISDDYNFSWRVGEARRRSWCR